MNTVAVAGMGLIGASFAKAFKACNYTVLGYDNNDTVNEYAKMAGIIDDMLTDENISLCDYIFIALYPDDVISFIRSKAELISKSTIVIDCAGTKRSICKSCFPVAKEYGFTFIGGHPMAGTQFSGIKYSKADMFNGATMLLIPDKDENIDILGKIGHLMHEIGFRSVTVTTPEKHDEMIAFTSQLAHIVSNAYVKNKTAQNHHSFSAGSYKDMTRVAKLNEIMWTGLFMQNSDYLLNELNDLIDSLCEYKTALQNKDSNQLLKLLKDGRLKKEAIDTEWKTSE